MTHDRNLLLNYHEFEKHSKVGLGDGSTVEAVGVGNVCVRMVFTGIESKKAVLYDVWYVSKLRCNLFSVRAAAGKGNMLQFGHTRCWIWDKNRKLRGMGSLVDKLYQLDCEAVPREHASVATMQRNDIDLWHQRLGHLNGLQVKGLYRERKSKKKLTCHSVRDVWMASYTGNHLSRWERFGLPEYCN